MSDYREEDIPLTRLDLDPDNSRYTWDLESQREILEWMTSGAANHIGDKVFALAKDITEYGLNPLEKVMVTTDENNKKKYIVLEGNRRVTALKLLNNPDIAPAQWKKKYSQLINSSGYKPPKEVSCVVIKDIEVAFHFMEVKHLGESGGVGIVPWGTEEKARHQKRQNKKSREHKSLSLLDHVRESSLYSQKTKANANTGFPITTLERLLGDKDFRESIGLTLDGEGNLAFRLDPKEVSKAVTKIINDLGSGEKKVDYVKTKEKREIYRNEFSPGQTPNNKKILKDAIPVEDLQSSGSTPSKKGKSNYQYVNPKNRKKLIISGTTMPIDAKLYNRPRRIYDELKQLPLQGMAHSYPNSIAFLIRSFLEMSIDAFIKSKKLKHISPSGWRDVSLTERAKSVKDYLKDNKHLDIQQIKVINKVLADKNKQANPNSLNDYVHNVNQIISPKDLIDVWDTYTDFLSCIWVNIK